MGVKKTPSYSVHYLRLDKLYNELHQAISSRQENLIINLLKNPDLYVNLRNDKGITPLIFAINCQYPAAINLLLQDARVDATRNDSGGWTPLMYAACFGDTETAVALLQKINDKSHVKIKNKFKLTAEDIARINGFPQLAELISNHTKKNPIKSYLQHKMMHFTHKTISDNKEPLLAEDPPYMRLN